MERDENIWKKIGRGLFGGLGIGLLAFFVVSVLVSVLIYDKFGPEMGILMVVPAFFIFFVPTGIVAGLIASFFFYRGREKKDDDIEQLRLKRRRKRNKTR